MDQIFGRNPKIFILCYHSISDDSWRFGVSLSTLEKQIKFLSSKYSAITLQDVESVIKGKRRITQPSFVITFDDGYKEVLLIRNLMKKLGITPTLFMLSDTKNPDYKELDTKREFLTPKDMQLLLSDGWNIGSHGATHTDFWNMSSHEIEKEIIGSRKQLQKVCNRAVSYFAYPKGRYTKNIVDTVKKAGYQAAFSMDDGKIDSQTNLFTIPRVGVDRTHTFAEFQFLFSPSVIAFRKFIKEHIGIIV
ncbi:MAG TPA: polysaccharide deacetylase family protein [Candidatus Eisenbacteria bacterium]|nr:polysaccharide deacetylase family protein [Candidatus Eisenbacteria bacterium]